MPLDNPSTGLRRQAQHKQGKLRDRLGFCLPAALRVAQAGDSPSRGE